MCFFKDELTVHVYFIFNSLQKYIKKPEVECRPFIVPVFEMKVRRTSEENSSVKCTAFYDLIFCKLY